MALPKLFQRIFWHNNTTPAINEDNLNAMSKGLDDVDDRLIALAGTIMEDVPQIIEDMEILEPAIENIDANVARAETAADNAEADALKSEGYAVGTQDGVAVTSGEYYQNNAKYYAEIANPPIENTVDFTDIITISDAINKAAKDVRLKIEAVQDLHGYTKPWVGGVGNNKLPLDLATIKSLNTSGTWSGNTYTFNGGTFTVQTDSDGNVTTIKLGGTTTDGGSFNIAETTLSAGTYYFFGGVGLSASGGVYVNYSGIVNVATEKTSYTLSESKTTTARFNFVSGKNLSGITLYPMIALSIYTGSYEQYENKCPITGWTGAKPTVANENLFNGTYNEFVYCPIPKNTQFTASIDASASGVYFGVYDKYKNEIDYWILSNATPDGNRKYRVITLEKDVYYVKFYSAQGSNYAVKLGDDKVFSPYATTYTINLGDTRYGGTLDVTSGVLTLNKKYVDLGTLSYSTFTVAAGNLFRATVSDIKQIASNSVNPNFICSNYPSIDSDHRTGYVVTQNANSSTIDVIDSRYSDTTTFKAAMDGVGLVYELATPQTIQLTAAEVYLLYGYNTLFGDCGDISLTYDASGIIHIDEAKLDTETLKTIAAASSDFADFKARIAAL